MPTVDELFRSATVRVQASGETTYGSGTGVFVAPNLVITCRHVLESESGLLESGTLDCFVNNSQVVSFRLVHSSSEEVDLALLEAIEELPSHSWVRLARSCPLELDVEFLSVGFPAGSADAEQARFSLEGTKERGSRSVWKLRRGQAVKGMSGAGLLHPRSRSICGLLSETRGEQSDLGAFAIPIDSADEFSQWLEKADASPDWDSVLPDALFADQSRFAVKAVYDRSRSGLNEPPEVKLPSPLLGPWNDFLNGQSWRTYVLTGCQWLIQQGERFDSLKPFLGQLEKLNTCATYDQIVSGLRSLQRGLSDAVGQIRKLYPAGAVNGPKEIGEIARTVAQLKDEAESPKFQRCFLVLGNVGSGKTSFLVQLLEQSEAREGPLVAVLEPLPGEPLEQAVYRRISEWSGSAVNSPAALTAMLQEMSRPVVVALDDAHQLMRKEPARLSELSDLIRQGTRHENLYWLILADASAYDVLVEAGFEGGKFWSEYGFGQARSEENEKAVAGGFLALDEYNQRDLLGIRVFKELAREGSDLTLVDSPEVGEHRYLANPWLARLLWSLHAKLNTSQIANLQYFEFLNGLWELRRGQVLCGLTDSAVARAVGAVSSVLLSSVGLPAPERLEEAVISTGIRPEEGKRLLRQCLADAGLLRISAWEDPNAIDSMARHGERVDLLLPLFWEWRAAIALTGSGGVWPERISSLPSELLDRQSVCQFALLAADSAGRYDPGQQVWSTIHKMPDLRAAAWFALPKAKIKTQSDVWARIAKAPPQLRAEDRRDLFALLFMITEVSAQAVPDPAARIRLVRPYYGLFGPAGLSEYFGYSACKAVETIGNLQQWIEIMLALEGCHHLPGVAERVASVAVPKLMQLASAVPRTIEAVIDYTQQLSNIVKDPEKSSGGGRRFYKFVLDGFASSATHPDGVRVFQDFYLRGWYDGRKLHLSRPVALSMRQALNCALGEWYRHHRWRDEAGRVAYIGLVNSLAASRSGNDREIAVYLIRHSEATWGRDDVRVSTDFRPALQILTQDQALVSDHSELFRVNLSHDL